MSAFTKFENKHLITMVITDGLLNGSTVEIINCQFENLFFSSSKPLYVYIKNCNIGKIYNTKRNIEYLESINSTINVIPPRNKFTIGYSINGKSNVQIVDFCDEDY